MPGRTSDTVFEERLWDEPVEPGTKELADPGVYPGFELFCANLITSYLRYVPGRISALVSAYQILIHDKNHLEQMAGDLTKARNVFLDSGAISALNGCKRGIIEASKALEWLERQDEIVALAHLFHDAGCATGLVAALDLPAYPGLLTGVSLTVDQAQEITLRNAERLLAAKLPEGWKPVFTSQGVSIEQHRSTLEAYQALGVLDVVRAGGAWLAVGGMAFENSDHRVHVVHRFIRDYLGEGHIHALGVNRVDVLAPMVNKGWVDSSDSSSPAQKVRYNIGVYHVDGPRPTFLWEACHAANALYYEARLAAALAHPSSNLTHEQAGMWEEAEMASQPGLRTEAIVADVLAAKPLVAGESEPPEAPPSLQGSPGPTETLFEDIDTPDAAPAALDEEPL